MIGKVDKKIIDFEPDFENEEETELTDKETEDIYNPEPNPHMTDEDYEDNIYYEYDLEDVIDDFKTPFNKLNPYTQIQVVQELYEIVSKFKYPLQYIQHGELYEIKEPKSTELQNIENMFKQFTNQYNQIVPKPLTVEDINKKEIIDVKEFEILFGYGKESQKKFRSTTYNPLETINSSQRGKKILYNREEAELWIKRYRTNKEY